MAVFLICCLGLLGKQYFMKDSKKDIGLILAIVFASSVVSGSLVFFGMQKGGSSLDLQSNVLDERIEKGIENYVAKQEQKAKDQQAKLEDDRQKENGEKAKNVPAVSDTDHVRGGSDTAVTLVEYSDFSCPFCVRFHATAIQILDEYEGKVNWVYRHYPLAFHNPGATNQASASECVAELGGNDKFWEFGDKIVESGVTSVEDLAKLAGSVGVNEKSVLNCIKSEKYLDIIEGQMNDGVASGVTGTPGNLLINNKTGEVMLVEGAQPFSAFKQVIDGMLSS